MADKATLPPRSLKNPVFQFKMVLLAAAIVATAICRPALKISAFWSPSMGGVLHVHDQPPAVA